MAVSKNLFGTNRNIPVSRERNWGAQVTSVLSDLISFADAIGFVSSDQGILRLTSAAGALAEGATLTPTKPLHKVAGSGGPVTLDGTQAIASGTVDGQVLVVLGGHQTNTVTIPSSAKVVLNGSVTLGLLDAILLIYHSSSDIWTELARSS